MPVWRKGRGIWILAVLAMLSLPVQAGPGVAAGDERERPDAANTQDNASSGGGCAAEADLDRDPSADGLAAGNRRAWSKHMKARARDRQELDRQQADLGRDVTLLLQAATGTPPEEEEAKAVFSSLWTVDPIYDLRNAQILLTDLLSRARHLQAQLEADRRRLACIWSDGHAVPDWAQAFGKDLEDWQLETAVTVIMLSTKQDQLAPVVAAWARNGEAPSAAPRTTPQKTPQAVAVDPAPQPAPQSAAVKSTALAPVQETQDTEDRQKDDPQKEDRQKVATVSPGPGSEAATPPPRPVPPDAKRTLVTVIRFDMPNVDLRPGLRAAVSASRRSAKDVILVAVSPLRREEQTFLLERAAAQQYARAVGRALAGLGVAPDHIYMASVSRGDINASEVQIYVQPSSGEGKPR